MATIWLVEDHSAFRKAIERALNSPAGGHSARGFDHCEDALSALKKEEAPDVILLDVGLPGMSGIEGIPLLKEHAPEACILILTVFEDDEKIFNAICAGASGYLLKNEPLSTVKSAISQAIAGGAPMTPRIASRVLSMFSKMAPSKHDYGLNERETSVLKLMVDGLAKKQIASGLQLNPHTLDYVMRCLYKKLHVQCQSSAVSLAVKHGIVER